MGKIILQKIKTAANYLVGTHDYRNFCKMDVANGVVEFIRRINKIEIVPVNPAEDATDGCYIQCAFAKYAIFVCSLHHVRGRDNWFRFSLASDSMCYWSSFSNWTRKGTTRGDKRVIRC